MMNILVFLKGLFFSLAVLVVAFLFTFFFFPYPVWG
jgi:hypothetical protein